MSNETSYEFETFDQVLVRDSLDEEWHPDLFVRFAPEDEDGDKAEYPYITLTSKYRYCIPYDEDIAFTKEAIEVKFKKGDTVEFIYLRVGKWFRGTITEVSTKEIKGDSYIYRVDFIDNDGDKDWVWCKLDQLREACVNADADDDDDADEKNEKEEKKHKFQINEKVWYNGQYSDYKWTMATVKVIDDEDDELPYRIELFSNNATWWVKEEELKPIDDYPL